jgi:hypothetical protein
MFKKIIKTALSLASPYVVQTTACAQEEWKFQSSLAATTGHYTESVTLKNLQGLGIRVSGERNQSWGVKAGLQSTRIDMQPIVPMDQKIQDDWFLSGFVHVPSSVFLGRWTLQLDTYKTSNNAIQDISSDVLAVMPQVIWQSYALPLKIDLSYARSKYKNTNSIYQTSAGMAIGFNEAKNWLQLRSYNVRNLTPINALGQAHYTATDIKLTHLFSNGSTWMPASITLGLERGKKFYAIDVASQTIYNLPMLNEGGENVTASWKISEKTDFNLHWSRNQYRADRPWAHRFTLNALSANIARKW